MPIEATSQTTEGHVYILYGNDDLNVAAGITIRSSTTDAVTTWDGQHKITVSGTILGFDDGINMIGTSLAQTVTISSTGRIETANDGSIVDADGVILDGVGSVLTNAGTIIAQGSGASLFVRDAGTTTVANSGFMSGIVAGVWNKFGSGTLNFTNTGTVESPSFAFLGGLGADNVVNKGTLRGAVSLGMATIPMMAGAGTFTAAFPAARAMTALCWAVLPKRLMVATATTRWTFQR